MALKAGIVGLPNVGKSTLFNAITSSHVEAANYTFATINPNSGIVEVNDERVDKLVELFQPRKTVKTTLERLYRRSTGNNQALLAKYHGLKRGSTRCTAYPAYGRLFI